MFFLLNSMRTPPTNVLCSTIIEENVTTGDMLLEKILEEDSNCDDRHRHEYILNDQEHEYDKKHLLGNGHTVTVHVTRI